MIKLDNVSKTYRGPDGIVRALEGVSLEVSPGEFAAVQGPSGCGKTTLLLTAGALLSPDGGAVVVNGTEPYRLSSEARARFRATTIGFVFQQFHLVPYLSVLDNVLAAALATGARADGRAEELLRRFGVWERRHHVPSELSTGERQRVALARALLNSPKVLLADEPTGNLDAANAEAVFGALTEFASSGGAVLLVTHDDGAAARAQRVVRLVQGRVVG